MWQRLLTRSKRFHTPRPGHPRTEQLTFLDDKEHRKVYPSNRARAVPGKGIVHRDPLPAHVQPACHGSFTWSALRFHRHPDNLVLEPLGSQGASEAHNPWSACKFLSVALAARSLRAYNLGLHTELLGVPLGDLVTLLCCYDRSRAFGSKALDSNSVACYFHSLIGPAGPTEALRACLELPPDHTFETTYGINWKSDPRLPVPTGYGAASGRKGGHKKLSLTFLAKAWAGCLLHLHPEDLEVLLYGALESQWYPANLGASTIEIGGLSSDPSIYFQSALDICDVERQSRGCWRIFSKLGFGPATNARDNQFVVVGHVCLPVLDEKQAPVVNRGREFILAARLDGTGLDDEEADRLFAENIALVVRSLIK